MGKSTFTRTPALVRIERIVAMLIEPMTWTEVAELLYTHPQTASRYLWHLARQERPRRIHVAKWIEDPECGRKIPVFKAGDRLNKKKPPRLTSAEVFARIQVDPARREKRREGMRLCDLRRNGKAPPQKTTASPFAALGL